MCLVAVASTFSTATGQTAVRPIAEPPSWFSDFNNCCAQMPVEAYSIKVWVNQVEVLTLKQQPKDVVQRSLRSVHLTPNGRIEALFTAYGPGKDGRLSYLTQAYYAGFGA
jgi:hypothetical protein